VAEPWPRATPGLGCRIGISDEGFKKISPLCETV